MRFSAISLLLRRTTITPVRALWPRKTYVTHSFSAHYPNRMLYKDQYIKGYLRFGKDGSYFLTHPVIHSLNIRVTNVKLSYIESTLTIKLRPAGQWLKPVNGEMIPFKDYLETLETGERERLAGYLSVFPTIENLFEEKVFYNIQPIADIVCVTGYWVRGGRANWGVISRHMIDGEEEVYLDPGSSAPLLKVRKDVDLSMLGPNDHILFDLFGPLTRKDTRQTDYLEVDIKNIVSSHKIRDQPFSNKILNEARYALKVDMERELERRRDLRNLCVFSIDPPTAKDLDDALSISPLEGGLYEVGIHIADVSHYVKLNSKICEEAGLRGNSFYLQDKVIHMLPRELSEESCSLNPGQSKLAFSVLCTLNEDGEFVGSPWIGETVISSVAKLSYDQSDEILDGNERTVEKVEIKPDFFRFLVVESLQKLHKLSVKMRARRFEAGAINVNNIKMSNVGLQHDDMPLIVFSNSSAGKSSKLIEEFMLLANTTVAKFLNQHLPKSGLFRQHSPPFSQRSSQLVNFLQSLKVLSAQEVSSKEPLVAMRTVLKKVSEWEDKSRQDDYTALMSTKFITHMQQAKYVYDLPFKKLYHYGLATECYTHFTSPIRRFADLIVHHQLKACLGINKYKYPSKEFLKKYTEICNERRTTSRYMQWDLSDFYLSSIVQSYDGEVMFTGYLVEIGHSYIVYFCPNTGHFGRIELKKQGNIVQYKRNQEGAYEVTFKNPIDSCPHEVKLKLDLLGVYMFKFDNRLHSDSRLPRTILLKPMCVKCYHDQFFLCTENHLQLDPADDQEQEQATI